MDCCGFSYCLWVIVRKAVCLECDALCFAWFSLLPISFPFISATWIASYYGADLEWVGFCRVTARKCRTWTWACLTGKSFTYWFGWGRLQCVMQMQLSFLYQGLGLQSLWLLSCLSWVLLKLRIRPKLKFKDLVSNDVINY